MDENVDPTYTKQLRRLKPDLFVLAVGELTEPPRGTLDLEILCWCEEHGFVLVTNNRKFMPIHLAEKWHLEKLIQHLSKKPEDPKFEAVVGSQAPAWERENVEKSGQC
jgi:hypothetical protein